jgi:hypothetical protein
VIRRLPAVVVFAVALGAPTIARADSIVIFMTDCFPPTSCPGDFTGPAHAWFVDVAGGSANVRVSGDGNFSAFQAAGFNLAGPTDGLTIDIHTPGFTFGGSNEPIGPFGGFEYVFDGPFFDPRFPPPDLEFTLSRAAGFASALDVFEPNSLGYFVATNGFNFDAPGSYHVAADTLGIQASPIPEPGSMMLLGSGLIMAWRAQGARRRRAKA